MYSPKRTVMTAPSDDQLWVTVSALREKLEAQFSPELSRSGQPGLTPSAGLCAAVAVIVHDMLGGELVSTVVDGESHWFNRLATVSGVRDVDITGDQFGLATIRIGAAGELYPETRVRSEKEVVPETRRRSELLRMRSGL